MSLLSVLSACITRIGTEIKAVRAIAESALTEIPVASSTVRGGVVLDDALAGVIDFENMYYHYATIASTGAPGEVPCVPGMMLFGQGLDSLSNQVYSWSNGNPGDEDTKIERAAMDISITQSLNLADSALQGLTERNDWAASTAYARGDIVTSQYARWYCKTAHTSAGTWAETNWIHLGLYAVGATSNPGVAGRLWVDIT